MYRKIADATLDEINQLPPEDLETRGVVQRANDGKSYVCPVPTCQNGTHTPKSSGIIPKYVNGAWLWHCFSCDAKFNNFKILSLYYRLDTKVDFAALVERICTDFGIRIQYEDNFNFSSNNSPARQQNKQIAAAPKEKSVEEIAKEQADAENAQKKLALIRADLSQPDNLFNYPNEKYCGLNMESLRKFGVIYVKKWLPIWARLKNKNATPTPRMLFPAGEHYLARLTVPIENYKNARDFEFIKEKPHEGQKHPFGIWTITAQTKYLIVVEGEKDCISIWQALNIVFEGNEILETVSVVATCSAITGGKVADEIVDCLKKFNLLEKIKVLISFDNDDTGKKDAPELRKYFLNKDISAVFDFLPTHEDGTKRDANDILVEGDDNSLSGTAGEIELANLILKMIEGNETKWVDSIAEINALCYETALKAAEKEKRSNEKIINKLLYLPNTDMDNATRIAIKFGDVIRYNTDTEFWGFFNSGVWKFETSSNSALYPFTRQIAEIIKANTPELPEPKKNADGSIDSNFEVTDEQRKHVAIVESLQRSWRKQKTQRNAIEMLKGVPEIFIKSKELDAHPNLINCKNGVVVDLRTGKYFPASADFYLTQKAGANFNPNWQADENHIAEKFLRDILPESDFRECLLMWLGYCLTGEVNEEKFLFIKGRGGNGKGTLTKFILRILGDYGCSIPIGGILRRKNYDANAATTAINILENKRAAFAEEIPPNAKVDPAQIKLLTGGDDIPIRKNYGEYQNINPTFKMTFSGNNDLQFPDANDYGIKRRLINIPFAQDFTGDKADPALKAKLLEQSALDYFFNKLIRKAKDWYKTGLQIPEIVKTTSADYLKSQDFIADFIAENCDYDANSYIKRADFVKRLRDEYPRETPTNNQDLKEMLEKTLEKFDGVEYIHSNKGKILKGLKWRD